MNKEHLDEIVKYKDDLKGYIEGFPLHEDDIRSSFFQNSWTVIYDYYVGTVALLTSSLILNKKIAITSDVTEYRLHLGKLAEVSSHPMLTTGRLGTLKRGIILGSWTIFEMCITVLFDSIAKESDLESIIEKLNPKLLKLTKDKVDKVEIMNILKKTSFIPLMRKFNFLVDLNPTNYSGNFEDDRKFIEFYTKLRNCMVHSGGLYHGNNFEYTFNAVKFTFNDNKIFKEEPHNAKIYWLISHEIIRIFKALLPCTNNVEFIPYPEDEITYN